MFKRTRDYAKDYTHDGKSVCYTGKHYRLAMPRPELNRRKAAYLLLLICSAGLYLSVGLSGAASLGGAGEPAAFYVVLPYVVLLLPLGLAFVRALLLTVKNKPLEYAEYDKYLVRQKGALIAALILCGCLILGNAAFLFFAAARGRGEAAALAESFLCGLCIFGALSQFHTLFACVAIDENGGVRYDI